MPISPRKRSRKKPRDKRSCKIASVISAAHMTRKLALCTLVVALVVATNANECRVTNESLRTGCRLILTSNRTCFFRRSVKRDQRVTVVVDDLIAASRRNAKNGGKCKRGRWLKIQHESPLKINSSRTLCNRETMTATYGEGNLLILSRLAKQDCFKLTLTFAKNPRRSSFRCRRSAGASPPTFDVDNCGRYNTSRHVRDRVPWTVQLRILNDANPVCVGSLVNDRWVVTAAHCFDNIPAKNCHVHVPGNRRNFSIVTAAIHRRYGVSGRRARYRSNRTRSTSFTRRERQRRFGDLLADTRRSSRRIGLFFRSKCDRS